MSAADEQVIPGCTQASASDLSSHDPRHASLISPTDETLADWQTEWFTPNVNIHHPNQESWSQFQPGI